MATLDKNSVDCNFKQLKFTPGLPMAVTGPAWAWNDASKGTVSFGMSAKISTGSLELNSFLIFFI